MDDLMDKPTDDKPEIEEPKPVEVDTCCGVRCCG